jgi:hypothetical protein
MNALDATDKAGMSEFAAPIATIGKLRSDG